VQVFCVVAIAVLFVRSRTAAPVATVPPRHPHTELLARIDALRADLEGEHPRSGVPWNTGREFNELLQQAQYDTQRPELQKFLPLVNDQAGYVDGTDVGVLRASLGQIRVIVEHSD
jgi:hypothetical protein